MIPIYVEERKTHICMFRFRKFVERYTRKLSVISSEE